MRVLVLSLDHGRAQGKTQPLSSHQSAGVGGGSARFDPVAVPADASLSAFDAVDRVAGYFVTQPCPPDLLLQTPGASHSGLCRARFDPVSCIGPLAAGRETSTNDN